MKIAFFSDAYLDLTGGIASSMNAQKAELERRGHEVEIFSTGFWRSPAELEKLARQKIYLVPSCKWLIRGVLPISRRPEIVEKRLEAKHPELKDFDVFYVHYEAGCSIAALKLAKKYQIPSLQVMHGREDMGETNIVPFGLRTIVACLLNHLHAKYIPHPIKIKRDNYLANTLAKTKMWELMVNHANYADHVITPSHHFCKKLTHYGVTKKIGIFPNGFSDEKFPKNLKPKKLKKNDELKIIWHSRVSGEKRIMPFLEALAMVPRQYLLDVYGDGAELKKAERFANQHQLNAVFHGEVKFEELESAMREAQLDVLASYNFDNYAMTLVEAEAYGTPALICDPDMQEIMPRGGYILSRDESPAAMAEAIRQILDQPEKIQKMSEVMLKNRKEVLISKRIEILEQILRKIARKNNC